MSPAHDLTCDSERHLHPINIVIDAHFIASPEANLIFDTPPGRALYIVERKGKNPVIITNNPCPEYQLTLLNYTKDIFRFDSPTQVSDNLMTTPIKRISPQTTLTKREQEVLVGIAAGKNNQDISSLLQVSEQTVKNYTKRVYSKLFLESRVQAANYYFGIWMPLFVKGWIPPPHVLTSNLWRSDFRFEDITYPNSGKVEG